MSDFSLLLQWRSVQSMAALELQGQPVPHFLGWCFLWLSREGKQIPSLLPSLPLSPTRSISPSSRKPFETTQMEAGHLPFRPSRVLSWLSPPSWHDFLGHNDTSLSKSDHLTPSLQLHKTAKTELHSAKENCSQGRMVTDPHSGPISSYVHTVVRIWTIWSPGRKKTWNVNLNEGGWQPQAGPLTAVISEKIQEGRRQEKDEMETNIPNS